MEPGSQVILALRWHPCDALSKSINSRRFIAVPEAQDWALYRLNLAHWISPPMSALGQKQTLQSVRPMSALPPKADIAESDWHVRFVP